MLKGAVAIVAVGAVLVAILVAAQWRRRPLMVSGFIEADEIRVGSRVGGRVKSVLTHEGATVKAGEVLIELDPYDLLDRRAEAGQQLAARQADAKRLRDGFRPEEVAQAQARRDQLAAKLEELKAGPRRQEITAAESRVDLATAQLALAQSNFERVKASFTHSAASTDEMQNATESLKAAQSTQAVRQAELDQLKEGTRREQIEQAAAQLREAEAQLELMQHGNRAEDIAAAAAAAEAARAALAGIDQQIQELTIRAPMDAVVEAMDLRVGDLVAANAPVLSLIDTAHLWVRAYVPENRLKLTIGQKVPVTVDSFPQRQFAAHISFIARQAEFTPNNVQTPEERSKQVFRIKVTLDNGLDVLRPGMAADVWLEGK